MAEIEAGETRQPCDADSSEFEEVEVEVTDDEEEEEEEETDEEVEYEEVEYTDEEEGEEEDKEEQEQEQEQEEVETGVEGGLADTEGEMAEAEDVDLGGVDDGTGKGDAGAASEEAVQQEGTAGAAYAREVPPPAAAAAAAAASSPQPASEQTSGGDKAPEAAVPASAEALSHVKHNLEETATKTSAAAAAAAADLSKAAFDYGSKLSSAFSSYTATVPSEVTAPSLQDAKESVNKLVGGFSNWFTSLDSKATQDDAEDDEITGKVTTASKASEELQKLFELPDHENLVEQFKCKLLQTYSCGHNTVTPAIQMAFQGTLYITDRHTCFTVEERGRKLPFKVLHSGVTKVTRQRPPRKGDLSDILRIDLAENEQWLSFKDFASGGDLDSALALLEHLTNDE